VLSESQLYYYKARVYDPVLGRFLQTDPVGGKDDPLNKADPTGLDGGCIYTGGCRLVGENIAKGIAVIEKNTSVSVSAKGSVTAGPIGVQGKVTADKQTLETGTVSVSSRTQIGGVGASAQVTVNVTVGPSSVGDQPATIAVKAGLVGVQMQSGDRGRNAELSCGPQIGAKFDFPSGNSPVSGGVQLSSSRVDIVGADSIQAGPQMVIPQSASVGSPGLCGLGGHC
jgi:hypothetical protein